MMCMYTPADLPPPYSSLDIPTTDIAIIEASTLLHYEAHNAERRESVQDNSLFEDKTTRIAFIQKVVATKLLQLLGMCIVMAIIEVNRGAVLRFMDNVFQLIQLTLLLSALHSLIFILLVCCHKVRRKNPYRYLFLVVYPLNLAALLSIWAVKFEILAPVLLSFMYYSVFLFSLLLYSVFACQTKLKFAAKYGIVGGIGTQIIMYAITVPFLEINPIYVLYPTIILLLEYIYLLYDIEAMTSKNYWYIFKSDDYIDGTINLHIDYFNVLYNSKVWTAWNERRERVNERQMNCA